MRYPEFLKDGGRIGFIAPSFGCAEEPYKTLFSSALDQFAEEGYRTVLGPNCYRDDGVGKSTTPEACAAEINEFFTEDRSDIIISCGGGETMCEDLPFVDFDRIAASKPKWFMGYSDNTNLVFTLPILCDTAAIYGPNAASFGQRPRHQALKDAMDVLKGRTLTVSNYEKWEREEAPAEESAAQGDCDLSAILAPYNCTEDFSMRIFRGRTETEKTAFSGRLIGGCLDCLVTLCGTRFDKVKEYSERYADDGLIWFIEACDLGPMGIRRALWQLKSAGWFDRAKGFIFGRPLHYDEEFLGVDRISAVTESVGDLGLPILLDTDLGHLPPQMPLIAGAVAEVSAQKGSLEIRISLR